jgi:hypothetical protein
MHNPTKFMASKKKNHIKFKYFLFYALKIVMNLQFTALKDVINFEHFNFNFNFSFNFNSNSNIKTDDLHF